jgi:hypothetical protein
MSQAASVGSRFNIFRRRPFLIIVPASPPPVASGKAQFKDAAIIRIENNISAPCMSE